MRKLFIALTLAASTIAIPVSAQEKAQEKADVKRDPKGIKGISPYHEDLATGRSAVANGDQDGAITAFDAAIQKDSDRIMAYLLKAQVLLAKGDFDGAYKTADTARSKRGTEDSNAKLLFFLASLDERKASPPNKEPQSELSQALRSAWNGVKQSWTSYATYLTDHSEATNHSATATERNKQVDARVKREEDFGAVADRIRKNQEDRDKESK